MKRALVLIGWLFLCGPAYAAQPWQYVGTVSVRIKNGQNVVVGCTDGWPRGVRTVDMGFSAAEFGIPANETGSLCSQNNEAAQTIFNGIWNGPTTDGINIYIRSNRRAEYRWVDCTVLNLSTGRTAEMLY